MNEPTSSPLAKELIASSFINDPRIIQAKKLLHDALETHQKQITGFRPPLASIKQSYDDMLQAFDMARGVSLWHPYIGSGFGKGALVELADGSIKYDFICGIGVHHWGHNHPDLLDANIDAALSNTIMQGNLQQNVDALELSSLLLKISGMAHCFLSTSGAMANENAIKIAFQKNYPANRILAFTGCFAGRSLICSQITDKPAFREGLPINTPVDYLPFFDPAHPAESTKNAVDTLKNYIKRFPKQHAIMFFEFIQGEGGFNVGEKEFFHALISILKENHIAVFADEVQSFARTSHFFAFQHFGLESFIDIASIGKASQLCVTFFSEEYKPRTGLLSQTFTASTSAIKASKVILSGLLNGGYFGPKGKIAKLHHYFANHLAQLNTRYPGEFKGPYGIGCMVAFTPFKGDTQKVTSYVKRLFDAGVISFIAGGGHNPCRVRFLIPVGAVTENDIDQVVKIIEETYLTQPK